MSEALKGGGERDGAAGGDTPPDADLVGGLVLLVLDQAVLIELEDGGLTIDDVRLHLLGKIFADLMVTASSSACLSALFFVWFFVSLWRLSRSRKA